MRTRYIHEITRMRCRDFALEQHSDHQCSMRYTVLESVSGYGDTQVEAEYWAPSGGGYVRKITADRPGYAGRQVVGKGGATLYWDPATGPLAATVLRHLLKRLWIPSRSIPAGLPGSAERGVPPQERG